MPSAFDGYDPNNWKEQEAKLKAHKAAVLGLTIQEYDDLQIWLKHGRIGRGLGYDQEVERAKEIDAAQRS